MFSTSSIEYQQVEKYNNINDFNSKLITFYENIQKHIQHFVTQRRYINILKSRTKDNIKQILFLNRNINLNELITLTENFKLINVKILPLMRSQE